MQNGNGFAVWLTGLPSSGKSAIAANLSRLLREAGVPVEVLDSDALRQRLTPHPKYTDEERDWFYDMVLFLAELLTRNGVNVLIAATAARRACRDAARRQIRRFVEVHVDCPVAVCRQRDPKGLWRRADSGEISSLPGAGIGYEPPAAPEVRIDTEALTVTEAAQRIFRALEEKKYL
jgi:adenylylsulfate kinase